LAIFQAGPKFPRTNGCYRTLVQAESEASQNFEIARPAIGTDGNFQNNGPDKVSDPRLV
jgi:hypothetical protein